MKRQDYRSYLLRLWRSSTGLGRDALWHASLESPLTGERRGFATVQELFSYLTNLDAEPDHEFSTDPNKTTQGPVRPEL